MLMLSGEREKNNKFAVSFSAQLTVPLGTIISVRCERIFLVYDSVKYKVEQKNVNRMCGCCYIGDESE